MPAAAENERRRGHATVARRGIERFEEGVGPHSPHPREIVTQENLQNSSVCVSRRSGGAHALTRNCILRLRTT